MPRYRALEIVRVIITRPIISEHVTSSKKDGRVFYSAFTDFF